MSFICQCCGNCCRWPGTVSATEEEMSQAAHLLGISLDQFIQRYTQLNPTRTKLIYQDQPDGACVFLDPQGRCKIYPARPRQCRTFPHDWDVPPDYQKLCAGRQKQQEETMTPISFVHVLGHPAKPLSVKDAPADAQVLNCRNMCLMLEFLKIPYVYYGFPGSEVPGPLGKFVSCGKPTGIWKYDNHWHRTYNARLSRHLQEQVHLDGSPELILSMYGAAQSDIDSFSLPVIEPMVGYDHCWAPYRVFPSYAHQSALYTLQPGATGSNRYFDTVIPHFHPEEDFWVSQHPQDYLLYLGRNAPDKGIGIAEDTAKATGLKLRVVHDGFFGEAKTHLIANARAVLMPTLYLEPFGYVAIEAQLCGTPVITTDWGAFPETVIHGETGFRCRTLAEFTQAVTLAPRLDRKRIRESAVRRFSLRQVAPQYESYFRFVWNVHNNGGFYAYGATRDYLWNNL